MTNYLVGVHDKEGHVIVPAGGWCLESVALSENPQPIDFTAIRPDINWLVRLNWGYGSTGTIPLPDQYQEFANRCAEYAARSKGAQFYIIANEINHEGERPNGVVIEPEQYARCFDLCYAAIKQAAPAVKVMHAAMAPYHASPTKWNEYLNRVLRTIKKTDGINVHAYTRSMNPDEIASQDEMNPPLENTYKGFWTYVDAFQEVPDSMLQLPAFITEFDAYHDWKNENTGVITAMYDDVSHWNSFVGHQPKIVAALCFRWLGPPDVQNAFDWEMRNKPNLLADFREAVNIGYKSPQLPIGEPTDGPVDGKGDTIFIPDVKKEEPVMTPIQRDIDPRLLNRGLQVTEIASSDPNTLLWKLVRARFFNQDESGGRHGLYVTSLDQNGNPVAGMKFKVIGQGSQSEPLVTNGKTGFDATNHPFWPSEGKDGYRIEVTEGDMVRNLGMGDDTPQGFNAGHHTSIELTYQRKAAATLPTQPVTPVPVPQPQPKAQVPTLAHPVADPKYRRITQGFGARPEYYSQFKIDGVPLKGHEGVDFGTPAGSVIVAVDDGMVTEVNDQGEKGYGKYVKVVHSWGETVYAHLQEQDTWIGAGVMRGQRIGLSGWSGNVEPKGPGGAHLHFGLRVKPFNRRDGWGGYENPMPYLINSGSEPTPTPVTSPSKSEVLGIVIRAAQEFGVDWRLLTSLIHGESSFNPLSENLASGAKGLGNIMPLTWQEWAPRLGATDIFNAKDNARVTAAYLDWCLDLVGGNVRRGLWCYNWSPRDVPKGLTPPPETIEFASKIIHGMEVLQIANP